MLRRFIPLGFLVLWVLPVAWVGLMRSSYPLYPAWIAPLFRVSGIFESVPIEWRIFFIEYRDQSGWHGLDERELFAPTPLGNRTRFQQLMNEIKDSGDSKQNLKILRWIAVHLPEVTTPDSKASSVRIIHLGVPTEQFLKSSSLLDIYQRRYTTKMPEVVDASLNLPLTSNETH